MMIMDSLKQQLDQLKSEEFVDALFAFMQKYGQSNYDESVTQLEHALQTAELARENGGDAHLVCAGLLHDLGHFLLDEHDDADDFLKEDLCHETVGAEFLEKYFPQSVIAPIRMHVPAKRYLCTVDADYYDQLSDASKRSFELQGGKLSEAEKAEMDSSPHVERALLIRRYDDRAKQSGKVTAPLDGFREDVLDSLTSTSV